MELSGSPPYHELCVIFIKLEVVLIFFRISATITFWVANVPETDSVLPKKHYETGEHKQQPGNLRLARERNRSEGHNHLRPDPQASPLSHLTMGESSHGKKPSGP